MQRREFIATTGCLVAKLAIPSLMTSPKMHPDLEKAFFDQLRLVNEHNFDPVVWFTNFRILSSGRVKGSFDKLDVSKLIGCGDTINVHDTYMKWSGRYIKHVRTGNISDDHDIPVFIQEGIDWEEISTPTPISKVYDYPIAEAFRSQLDDMKKHDVDLPFPSGATDRLLFYVLAGRPDNSLSVNSVELRNLPSTGYTIVEDEGSFEWVGTADSKGILPTFKLI